VLAPWQRAIVSLHRASTGRAPAKPDTPDNHAPLTGAAGEAHTVTIRTLALIALLPLAACGGNTRSDMLLYPLEGPIALADPSLVIKAVATDTDKTSGEVSFRLPEKRKCKGTWSSLAPKVISQTRGVSLTLKDTGGRMGTERKSVAGVNEGEIYAVCSDGTRVQGNFVIGSGTASGTGRATDTNRNVYKLLF
jgi:hypothetical protein